MTKLCHCGIEAFEFELEVYFGWGDTTVVITEMIISEFSRIPVFSLAAFGVFY
jgi:hypothetical protein